jgi:hypothetical protein
MFLLCFAFAFITFIIATNYISIKWSLIPGVIAFVLMYVGVSNSIWVLAFGVPILTFVALLITVIKNHFEK